MRDYRAPIGSSPLHAYYSCLVSMPDCGLRSQAADAACGHLVSKRSLQWHIGAMVLEGHKDQVSSVAFSPDGKQIVTGSEDSTVRVWGAVTGDRQNTLAGHTDSVSSVAFSPDSKQIVSGSFDHTVRVWNAVSGDCQHSMTGHIKPVTSVAFSPDSKQIVSGSYDGTVRVWDAVSGDPQHTLVGHTNKVISVTFSPDGKHIISRSIDRSAQVWDSSTGTLPQLSGNNKLRSFLPFLSLFHSATSVCIIFCSLQLAADPFPSRQSQ
jgi:WD40 repeat protein